MFSDLMIYENIILVAFGGKGGTLRLILYLTAVGH